MLRAFKGLKLKNENEENTETPEIEEIETPVPTPEIKKEEVADQLTDEQLDSKITKIVNEKVTLALDADDGDEEEEEEEEDKKGFGIFPLVIFGVLGLAVVSTIIIKKSPDTVHNDTAEETHV